MKKIGHITAVLSVLAFTSCKTSKDVTPALQGKSTNTIKVPAGFTWQNSRNIAFTVNVTDTRFQASIFMIAIYDGDPSKGANLLAKGSAKNAAAFKSTIYLSDQINQVYIVKTAPDNSKTSQNVQVGTTAIVSSIGI
ncbi:hypothetical protein HDF19_07165 [Mucilaginibacter sp. E4BP6]|uniref:hypothetical protein n=1 Tax=Mucilaginibacter sp. E4BP6 TaxID=2723089 RepID=UPI0015CD3EF9|nr:hypothetical protein [Mucilaginibacter sp. E4BP6]NYE67382.1 hypothetical protein [Mucilaginibacter sp. E4BP6]